MKNMHCLASLLLIESKLLGTIQSDSSALSHSCLPLKAPRSRILIKSRLKNIDMIRIQIR